MIGTKYVKYTTPGIFANRMHLCALYVYQSNKAYIPNKVGYL
jgi:hypothetical protein